MEISNPRRILAVSLESDAELLGKFIKDLTGSHPSPSTAVDGADGGPGLAGTTHELALKTPYYAASVPVWLDTVGGAPGDWADSFLSDEAREVLGVLGGVAVVFPLGGGGGGGSGSGSGSRDLVSAVGRVVREGLGGWDWDGVGLAVGVGEAPAAAAAGGGGEDLLGEWEECCAEAGLEFVHARPGGGGGGGTGDGGLRNEFGEKTGIPRVLEALQSNDWALDVPLEGLDYDDDDDDGDGSGDNDDGSEFGDFAKAAGGGKPTDLDPASLGFGFDKADFEGLRRAIWSSGVEPEAEDDRAGVAAGGSSTAKPSSSAQGAAAAAAAAATTTTTTSTAKGPGDTDGDKEGGSGGGGDGDSLRQEDVEKVEAMMRKLLAAREMGAGMPEEQRRRLAARAVGEVMREL
ncbi:hypothetical protein RB597_000170 [Gaeumannomyces tritici]